MQTAVAIVLVFALLVAIHEFGHYIVAKRVGVKVEEFAIGFGPLLYGRRKGETLYSLRLLPLGGFCRMTGLGESASEQEDEDGSLIGRRFQDKRLSQRMAIIAAGPLMNLLLAAVLFTAVFGVVGVPTPSLQVGGLVEGSPAEAAGLHPGDRVISIEGRELKAWNELQEIVRAHPHEPLDFRVERSGRALDLRITPAEQPGGGGLIGVEPTIEIRRYGPAASIGEGLRLTGSFVVGWFAAIGALITRSGEVSGDLMGPVAIGAQIGQAAELGLSLLLLAAVLSINLGLINLVPIPALDGSRLVFLGIEGLRGRPIAPEKENMIHFIGFALLLLLSVVITYRDLLRLGG